MFYDTIESKLIKLGKSKQFGDDDTKTITPIYYEGESLYFSLKNKYVRLDGIETSIYNKDALLIKSLKYSEIVEKIAEKVGAVNPVLGNGIVRAIINKDTKIEKYTVDELRNSVFEACISLNFATIFKDQNKTSIQIYVKDIIVTKIIESLLEVDFNKLELAE